jgi:hypothetical protein
MKQLNFAVILFVLFLFTSSAFALTYRFDVNNGSWSQYNTGLADYQTDLLFNTFNRGFEGTDFNFNHHSGANQLICDSQFCSLYNNSSAEGIQHASRSSTYAHTGTYSLKINTDGSATELFWSKNRELVGDVNISFWAISSSVDPNEAWVGYIDDRNNFTIGATLSAGTETTWRHYSFVVPTGNYTWAVSGNTTEFYIDDISITRNNTGTFRTTNPQFCGSIASCSNILENLPAQQLGTLYWVVDYVAGASCGWAKNGVSQGAMTEAQTGMYYALIDAPVTSSGKIDLNLSASCSKIPFLTKTFFVSPTLYRYGLVGNGNFSTPDINFYSLVTNQAYCTTSWCGRFNNTGEYIASNNRFQAGLGASAGSATPIWKFKDGRETLLVRSGNWDTLIWSQEYASSATINFWINVWNVGTGVIEYGYVNDSNVFTQVGSDLTLTLGAWQYISYSIPAGNYRPAWHNTLNADYFLDHVTSSKVKQTSTMTVDNNLTSNYGLRGTNYAFNSSYLNGSSQPITDGNCFLGINGTYYTMNYNAGTQKYSYATGFVSDGTYSIHHTCGSDSYNDQNSTYSIIIATAGTQILTLTPIQNVEDYTISNFTPNVHLNLTNDTDDVIFSIINNSTPTEITFDWLNFANTNGKQYSVYTSTDGVDWTFNDSATFGDSASYNDPVQKIPTISGHSYSFADTLPNATKVYFKLVFNQLPLAWETIASSSDWVNINSPTIYTDTNNNKWDLFADSNYTPIRSYTSKRFPDLTSTDLTTGFEIQFTAYAEQASNLKIGYSIDGVDTTSTVQITTTAHRYSVPVDPTSNEARLLIKSDGNNTNVYVTDYAIVPKAYFTGRLEVLNDDGSPLQAIINEGISKAYIREAIPYTIRTSAYDKDGDLHRLSVQASIGGITIKTKDFFLKDATAKDKIFTWDELIEGFVDLDGNAVHPVGMRSIYIKAVLYNTAGESVSEQSTTVKILQYPYFESDIGFNLYSLNAKVGENPSVRLNLNQKDPSQLIGVKIYIYDVNHSLTSPNYSTTILNSALGCNTFNCSKNLLIDDYVFEAETQYRIAVQLLLKTEHDSLTNPLTLKIFNQQVTYRNFETARILQVFERTDHTYRNDEPIALVLQLRDVPYKNLSGDTTVYLTADICSASSGATCGTFGTTKFYPKSFIYDETTGYNYFYFDQLFYTDAGALLTDGNYIRFQANITDKKYTHKIANIPTATLADKCASASYGSLFNEGWFNMNFWDDLIGATERALFGCGTLTSPIVQTGDGEEVRILIDADHNVAGGQNQSIACLKIDNESFQNSLEQDLVCGVLWNRNQQNIDKFAFTIGNENSDFSKTGSTAQYISFDVPAEQLIFNDAFMLKQALNSEYGTDSIDTVGEMFFYGFDKLFSGVANPLTDVLEGTTKTGLITNFGFDINWSNQLDPTFVKGIFFFKVKGLKVVNQYDYIKQFPALENTNPKYFREFANQNKLKLPIQNTLVNVYANDLSNWNLVGNQLDSIEVASPLVIYAKPSYVQTGLDTNQKLVATTLKFNLTSDMLANNQTSTQRVFLPLTFSYLPPARTDFGAVFDDILFGTDSSGKPAGLLTNPVGFGFKNWFWFLLGVVALLVFSLILRNFRTGGGGVHIPFLSAFWEGMASKDYVNDIRKRRGR